MIFLIFDINIPGNLTGESIEKQFIIFTVLKNNVATLVYGNRNNFFC